MKQKYHYYDDMSKLTGRLKREHDTLICMTHIYCDKHHSDKRGAELCPDCAKLMAYAQKRLEKCPYGANKPTCANCPIHCYKPGQKQQMRLVMKYSGPRMLLSHPILALRHLWHEHRAVSALPKGNVSNRHQRLNRKD